MNAHRVSGLTLSAAADKSHGRFVHPMPEISRLQQVVGGLSSFLAKVVMDTSKDLLSIFVLIKNPAQNHISARRPVEQVTVLNSKSQSLLFEREKLTARHLRRTSQRSQEFSNLLRLIRIGATEDAIVCRILGRNRRLNSGNRQT